MISSNLSDVAVIMKFYQSHPKKLVCECEAGYHYIKFERAHLDSLE